MTEHFDPPVLQIAEQPRVWHLSLVHTATGGPPGGDPESSDGFTQDASTDVAESTVTEHTPAAAAPIKVLPPLWYRIVTGQVLWWRIRRMLNRMLWWRRHAARRALRWTDRHPEIQQMLAREGALRLAVEQLRSRRGRTTRRNVVYHPVVTIGADVDISQLHDQPLVDDVEIVRVGAAEATHRLSGDSTHVEIVDTVDASRTGLVGAIDLGTWNPKWFRLTPTHQPVLLRQLAVAGSPRFTRLRAENAHRAGAVLCDADDTLTAEETAYAIAELAASGAPLAGHVSDEVAALLGAPLAEAIREVDADALADAATRERHSVRLRRLAHRDFSPRGTWRRIGAACGGSIAAVPTVSVLLPSNRADDVIEAARQAAVQCDVDVQLVVGLHGSHMSHDLDEQLADAFPGNLVVQHLPDEMNLGQVLNALTGEADGELVSKWDDDDWYDRWHLNDLVAALEYSGAAMVAKAAEFIYLEALDLTVRRFVTGSERRSTTVAGGTLLLARSDLERVGWADAPRRVDRLLIDALEEVGQSTYRMHGFGYVLRRRGSALGQHTWQAGDSYFLKQSQEQRRGLDLAFAGFDQVGP